MREENLYSQALVRQQIEKYGDVTLLTSGSQSQIQLGFPVAFDFKGIS